MAFREHCLGFKIWSEPNFLYDYIKLYIFYILLIKEGMKTLDIKTTCKIF